MIRASLSLLLVSIGSMGCGARTALPDGSPTDAAVSQDANPPTDADAGPPADAADCQLFAPADPMVLAALDEPFAVPGAVRVVGPYVYFSIFITSGDQNGSGVIYRLPTTGGELERVEEKLYNYGPIDHDGAYLYYPLSMHVDSTSTGYHPAVMARPLANGTTFPLSNPVSPGGDVAVSDLTAGPSNGVYWLVHPDEGGTVLAYWDGTTSVALAELSAWAYELVVTNNHAFMQANKSLYAAPLAGGEATVVRTLDDDAELLGANPEALFFTPDGTSILRRDASGQETTIAQGVWLQRRPYTGRVPAWVDASWVFYAEADRLSRVSTAGGAPEVLSASSDNSVGAISGDDCNVYWLELHWFEEQSFEQTTLMVRAIEP